MQEPIYPNIKVRLTGSDGHVQELNAFEILGRVTQALQKAGVSREEQQRFQDEATGGDYSRLIATVFKWVKVK